MRTIGIDLAAQPKTTASCLVEWAGREARIIDLHQGLDDGAILGLVERADVVGIDAPFGWPVPFVAFVSGHEEGTAGGVAWSAAYRDSLRFRRTDLLVRDALGRWPLSVSSDLIAILAMRCAGLIGQLGVIDRSGDGRVFEVYPAVALSRWGLAHRGYKNAKRVEARTMLVTEFRRRCSWLVLDDQEVARLTASDHLFDALVAALVARAAALGLTEAPPSEDAERARTEGWIAMPEAGSLDRLALADVLPLTGAP